MFNSEVESCKEKVGLERVAAGTVARINSDDESVTLKEARTAALQVLDDLVHIAGSEEVGVVITTPKHLISVRGNKLQQLSKEWKIDL